MYTFAVRAAASLFLASAALGQACEPRWSPLAGGGVSDPMWATIYTLCVYDDGSGPALYAGGKFQSAGNVEALSFARWDATWSVPPGSPSHGPDGVPPVIYTMTVFDDGRGPALYIGGWFSQAGGQEVLNLVRWDGKTWESVGGGLGYHGGEGSVYDLEVARDLGNGPELFAAGHFYHDGIVGIARWDGIEWHAVQDDTCCYWWWVLPDWMSSDPTFVSLAAMERGGAPGLVGLGNMGDENNDTHHIAVWSQSRWEFLEAEISGQLGYPVTVDRALARLEDAGLTTYFGGNRDIHGLPAVLRWSQGHWDEIAPIGPSGDIYSFAEHDDGSGSALYVGGAFNMAEGAVASGVARWDGQAWSSLGTGVDTSEDFPVRALVSFDDGSGPALYAGGTFSTAGGLAVENIARWRCPACPADCDGSGSLDLFDFLCFVNLYNERDPTADCTGEGEFDFFDFVCFINLFNAGC